MTEAAGVDSGELTLKQVVRLVEAAEMAKSVQSSVCAKGSLAGLSDHRREKEGKKLERRAESLSGGRRHVTTVAIVVTAQGSRSGGTLHAPPSLLSVITAATCHTSLGSARR